MEETMISMYQEVRNWIYRNARPLDFALFKYHFENGKAEDVINILTAYQNTDGGFGHALEEDSWNPNSAPIQTFQAVEMLRETNFTEKEHPVIQGILKYLDSGAHFDGKYWINAIQTNNDYPHAPWWQSDCGEDMHDKFNPTIGLAGFGLCYAARDSRLYHKCEAIALDAIEYFLQAEEPGMHVLNCYIAFWEYCEQADIKLSSMEEVKKKLILSVHNCITRDTSIWATSYICKPSQFFDNANSIFYQDNKEIAAYECKFIQETRNNEGVWDVLWGWAGYAEEWAVSKNWWKSCIAIKNLRYLKNFGMVK